MTDFKTPLIDVLICTYRRPDLLVKTLDGIARSAEKLSGVRAIVVDNDDRQSAREATQRWAAGAKIAVTYLSQPVQNISLTRNMALDNACAPWIVFIDDDEVPDENWLSALLGTAEQYHADVVFAPVIAEFDSDAPAWATEGKIFQRNRFATGSVPPIKEARTGNVLVRGTRLARDTFRFDPDLGLSGGEDSEFFARLARAQYRMVWCDEACVREWTSPSRTTVRWVLKRAFRGGSVDAYNKLRFRRFREAGVQTLKSFAFLAHGGLFALLWAPVSMPRCVQALRRVATGAGFFYGLFAGPYLEYGTPSTSSTSKEITQ